MATKKRRWRFLVVKVYDLLRLKQSRHFRLLVSLGVKGSEVMAPPQVAQVQLPSVRGLASVAPSAEKPSSSIGPLEAGVSKSAKSGTSRSS